MKNSNKIISGFFTAAMVGLFLLQSCGKENTNTAGSVMFGSDSASFRLPVAYIRTDSLLNNYNYSKDINESMMKEYEDHTLQLRQRQEKLKKEIEEFQRKANMNVYLTQERMNQEYSRLQHQEEELNKYAANIQSQLASKQSIMQQQLYDTIVIRLKEFNTPKKYDMIFSNIGSDNFYYIDDSYDITNEVLEFLNSRYVPAKK